MQLVLVAGFKASAGKIGPNVRLFEGKWRFCVEHLKDSILVLRAAGGGDTIPVNDKSEFHTSDATTHIEVQHAGTEPFINIFAELVSLNGSNPPKPA